MRIAHLIVIGLMVAPLALGAVNLTDSRGELDDFKPNVEQQIAGGGLDDAQTKAAEKLVTAIDKAAAIPAGNAAKFASRLVKVATGVEKAAKKGLDLSTNLADLDSAVRTDLDRVATSADDLVEFLADARHKGKIASLLDKAAATRAKALALQPGSKRMKKLSGEARKIVSASAKADKYFEKELEDGVLQLEIEGIELNGQPLTSGLKVTGPEFTLEFQVSVPVEFGTIAAGAIVAEWSDGGESSGVQTGIPDESRKITFLLDPLLPGTYTLVIRGANDVREHLAGVHGIPLGETVRLEFEVLP
jgi:hypothetical protein